MDEKQLRQNVSDAGRRLKKTGLIAGTWGNISVRLDDTYMIITPSGIDYETALAGDMVKVNYLDNSYEGSIKPSSEMKLHTEIYRSRKEIHSVIHTHSMNASTVAATRIEVPLVLDGMKDVLGGTIKVAKYALPSTKKIVKETVQALEDRKGALMANHGAVGIGKNLDEAFNTCEMVENACKQFITSKADAISQSINEVEVNLKYNLLDLATEEEKKEALCNAYAQLYTSGLIGAEIGSVSIRLNKTYMLITQVNDTEGLITTKDIQKIEYENVTNHNTDAQKIHSKLYRDRANVESVVITDSNNGSAVSKSQNKISAILDDMVQIIGPNVKIVNTGKSLNKETLTKISRGLKGRNGILTKNHGSITIGRDLEEAFTACIVMEKASKTTVDSKYIGGAKSINFLEAILMRQFYLRKYSKQKLKK